MDGQLPNDYIPHAVAAEPKVIKRYPYEEVPEDLEKEIGVPESRIPPAKGTIKRAEKTELAKFTEMAVSYPVDALPEEIVVIDVVLMNIGKEANFSLFLEYPTGVDDVASVIFEPTVRTIAMNHKTNFTASFTMVQRDTLFVVSCHRYEDFERKWTEVQRFPIAVKMRKVATTPPVKRVEAEKPGTYPLKLSMEEYNRSWKPKGWKIIFIGPTATWRREWGMWEAIREIVQNALDEAESYTWGYDDKGLFIKDSGRGVSVSDFLLGPPKLKDEWARGRYGEGMKIAGLVMAREGYPVLIETVGKELWIVFVEQQADKGTVETLAALWKEGGTKEGTVFHIIGYTGDAFADRFAVNISKKAILSVCPSQVTKPVQRYNQLIRTPEGQQSKIFARDIYMRDIESVYSYNLWSFTLAPDRHAPEDEEALWRDVGRVWCFADKPTLIKNFLKMVIEPPKIESEESRRIHLNYLGDIPGEALTYDGVLFKHKDLWQKAWEEINSPTPIDPPGVIRTRNSWDMLVRHLGYQPIGVQYGARDGLVRIIKTDRELIDESQEKLREVVAVPDSKLGSEQLASLKLAKAIVRQLMVNDVPVHAAIIPPASDRVRTAGLYGRSTREIFIDVGQLGRASQAVDTLVHELAHHTSDADDGEKDHYLEISRLAGVIVKAIAQHRFDNELYDLNLRW